MAVQNIIEQHFTAVQKADIDMHLDALAALFLANSRNATPEDKDKYGSINETNKLLVNKVRSTMTPTLHSVAQM
ncbi:MAG: hypothetical protein IPK62_14455 [Bacteroidetes bacterium]|nr:hypothetical protein [Bacteroidota bacterium]MBK8146095.1 hypothetical protein [Bacteroidota bacterium]MBP6313914.1 hypothetical protein [Chitinophagaceae bacterium]